MIVNPAQTKNEGGVSSQLFSHSEWRETITEHWGYPLCGLVRSLQPWWGLTFHRNIALRSCIIQQTKLRWLKSSLSCLVGGSNWSNRFSIRYLESKLANKNRQHSKNPKCTETGPPCRSRSYIGQSNGWRSNSFGYGFAASILVPGQGSHTPTLCSWITIFSQCCFYPPLGTPCFDPGVLWMQATFPEEPVLLFAVVQWCTRPSSASQSHFCITLWPWTFPA